MNQAQSKSRTNWIVLVAVGLIAYAAITWMGRGTNPVVGQRPPSLESVGTWINSASPLSWDALQGKVVWLEFSFIH